MQLKSTAWILAALMCGAAIAGVAGKPVRTTSNFPKLESAVPNAFGEWAEVREQNNQIIDPETQQLLNSIYDQVLTRTYVNKQGYRIMLSLAYGSDQRGGLQAHRPEVCYPAQGFKVLSLADGDLGTSNGAIQVRRLTTNMGRIGGFERDWTPLVFEKIETLLKEFPPICLQCLRLLLQVPRSENGSLPAEAWMNSTRTPRLIPGISSCGLRVSTTFQRWDTSPASRWLLRALCLHWRQAY